MNLATLRLVFGALCAFGFVAIAAGLLFEFGRVRRGASVLSVRQTRWRFVGGLLWLLILGSLGYATLFLWPVPNDKATLARYLRVVLGAMALLVVALLITGFDVYLTLAAAKLQRRKFEREAGDMARAEIERIRAQHEGSAGAAPNSEETDESV